jgi:hypothetical protein
MKITQRQLRQIIQEEVQKSMQEGFGQERTFATVQPGDKFRDPEVERAHYALRRRFDDRQALDRTRRAELRAQGSKWDAVYDVVSERFESRTTGPEGVWDAVGYRTDPYVPGPTHMKDGNYSALIYFILYNGPLGPDWRFSTDNKFDELGPLQSYTYNDAIDFVKEFELNFPGAFDQAKINRETARRPGGPGPNVTKLDPLTIPIPYFNDFKEVISTWITNQLTGENRPIPWPEDQGIT